MDVGNDANVAIAGNGRAWEVWPANDDVIQ
jgi:hypothetical protein